MLSTIDEALSAFGWVLCCLLKEMQLQMRATRLLSVTTAQTHSRSFTRHHLATETFIHAHSWQPLLSLQDLSYRSVCCPPDRACPQPFCTWAQGLPPSLTQWPPCSSAHAPAAHNTLNQCAQASNWDA